MIKIQYMRNIVLRDDGSATEHTLTFCRKPNSVCNPDAYVSIARGTRLAIEALVKDRPRSSDNKPEEEQDSSSSKAQ